MLDVQEKTFEFDRPSEHGLGTKSFGEGVLTGTEAREAVVDSIRDAVLPHYDPADAGARAEQVGR